MATVLITGSNRGIGLELTRQLAARGDTVLAACRSASDELRAVDGVTILEEVDVADADSVAGLADRVSGERIDLLINNAGVLSGESLDELDEDRIRRQFEVNALGPLRVTAALRERLAQGGKVAIVTSRMGSIADNGSGGAYGYRMSKAAVNAAGKSLSHDLRGQGVSVALLHPGWVQTDMTGGRGHVGPAESARGLIERIDGLNLENSGSFWHMNGEELPW